MTTQLSHINAAGEANMVDVSGKAVTTREAIAEGKFINEAVEHIDKENKLKWLLHDYQHSTNVSKTYTELEWDDTMKRKL